MKYLDQAVMIFAETYSKKTGNLSDDAVSRLKKGLEIWQEDQSREIIVTGGVHHPVVDCDREICQDMAEWLKDRGVSSKMIHVVGGSYDTWTDIKQSLKLIQEKPWGTIFLVSNSYHLKRIEAIFRLFRRRITWLREIELIPVSSSYINKQDVRHEILGWIVFWLGRFPRVKKSIWTRVFKEYRHLR